MKNDKESKILQALLTTTTIQEASTMAGTTSQTIYRYLNKPDFKDKLNDMKAELLNQATTALQNRTGKAINIISEIADNNDINPQIRLTACRTILEYNIKFTETNDIMQRLEALETTQDGL